MGDGSVAGGGGLKDSIRDKYLHTGMVNRKGTSGKRGN